MILTMFFERMMRRRPTSTILMVALVIALASWLVSYKVAAQTRPAVEYVQPIDWSRFEGILGVQPDDAFGKKLVQVLQNESRYELSWVRSRFEIGDHAPNFVGVPYYWAYTHSTSNGDIRPLASFAYGTAALLATGIYSESIAGGTTQAQALQEAEMAIRGVAFAHVANTTDSRSFGGGGFRRSSGGNQSAYYAAQAGMAAWLIWDRLAPATQTAVANMIEYETNSFNNYTVPYWKTPSGATNTAGDTKAEESAWNVQLLALAQSMMPNHPNVNTWRAKASELQVSVLSRQSDNFSSALVDGKPVKDWLNGFNAYADGALVNHSIVHPDYMAASIYLLSNSVVVESLAGHYIPQSTVFNVDQTYRTLTEVTFTPGMDKPVSQGGYGTGKSFIAPGGTIFKRNPDGSYSAEIYYPQDNDWKIYVVTDSYLNTDLMAEWLELDAGKDFDALGWAQARVDAMIALQNRPGHDGNIYEEGDNGNDEDFYRSNATAWLQWWLLRSGRMSPLGDAWGVVQAPEPNSAAMLGVGTLLFAAVGMNRRRIGQRLRR